MPCLVALQGPLSDDQLQNLVDQLIEVELHVSNHLQLLLYVLASAEIAKQVVE
jgi:hypothetical protein